MKAEMVLARAGEMVSAGRVFGTPIEREGVTLVPVAWVVGGGGGGEGVGAEGQPADGAGFGVFSVPMGAYAIKNGDVRFVPSYDVGLLVLVGAGLLKTMFKRGRGRRRG